jgi:fatty-acyl-CoA synthase
VAPLFHMLGMQAGMNLPIILGATVVMLPRWNAAAVARLIERHGISAWSAPPAMLVEFFAHPETQQRNLDSLAVLAGGGAAMPEAVAARLRDQFGIGYNEACGMTETAAFLLANPLSRGKMQCLGVPTFGVEVRVIDPVTLQEVAPGEVGELIVHGQQIMLGYWRNEKANATASASCGPATS